MDMLYNLRDINNKKNEIENLKKTISFNLAKISNSVVHNVFYFILDDIDNNIEINYDSLYSIYDFSEPLFDESKNYLIHNIEFIKQINLISNIDFDNVKETYLNFVKSLNEYVINSLEINNLSIDLSDYHYSLSELLNLICELDIDIGYYENYLDNIYNFYVSFNNCIVDMISKYEKYIC